jgi:hypothetical protein
MEGKVAEHRVNPLQYEETRAIYEQTKAQKDCQTNNSNRKNVPSDGMPFSRVELLVLPS